MGIFTMLWWGLFIVPVSFALVLRSLNGRLNKGKSLPGTNAGRPSVVFLHPDLGIGGAERLVVDAAVGLQKLGCEVAIYTNFHDPKRAFKETTDGTLKVVTVCRWIPRSVKGKGLVLFATVRMMLMALYLCVPTMLGGVACDVYFVDQVAGAMVPLKLFSKRHVFFYCHHPDQLCDPNRVGAGALKTKPGLLRRLYRKAFDEIEGFFMNFSDKTVCNSQYTRGITQQTFPAIASSLLDGDVLYPPINIEGITTPPVELNEAAASLHGQIQRSGASAQLAFVSLNRYERKKNINLAIQAFGVLLENLKVNKKEELARRCHLYVAGGYDPRLDENVEHHKELVQLAVEVGIPSDQVTFLRSISDHEKFVLLSNATCVVYTPSNEHFGIVPLEAMAHRRPVVAVNNGGPTESITGGDTYGFLREPKAIEFGEVLCKVVNDEGLRSTIGANARRRCDEFFSLEAFSKQLLGHLNKLESRR